MRKSVRNVFRAAVALSVLFCVLVSTFLGVSKAEYFKGLTRDLDVEISPDLKFSYYLYAAESVDSLHNTNMTGKGVYTTSRNFTQQITIGKTCRTPYLGLYAGADWTTDGSGDPNKDNHTGENIVYQIKVPVDEEGYYSLNFTVDFTEPGAEQKNEIYTINYDRAIGCEVLNYNDGFVFGDYEKPLDLWSRNNNKVYTTTTYQPDTIKDENNNDVKNLDANVKLLNSDSLYQWKTLAPTRQETVSLAFKVEKGDLWELNNDGSYKLDGSGNKIERGYVLWMWDFSGLYGPRVYDLEFTNVSIKKTMTSTGVSEGKDADDPYFVFPQTQLVNNQLVTSLPDTTDKKIYDYMLDQETQEETDFRSVQARGKVSYSKGRGTFTTEATANSLAIQAESIMYPLKNTGSKWYNIKTITSGEEGYTNPVSFRVPIKNIEAGKTYKVTFDISFARQGNYAVGNTGSDAKPIHPGLKTAADMVNYADFADIFWTGNNPFQSYLYSGDSVHRSSNHHAANGLTQIKYNDKTYQNEPLTKYNEFLYRGGSGHETIDKATVTTVNDTYTIGNEDVTESSKWYDKHAVYRNWFNAVQHTECNGQNEINWITFYNTTFAFNIKEGQSIDLNNLYWVWEISPLIPSCYYRIRLDNVRIEKVVKYGSNLSDDGVRIGGTQIDLANHANHYQETEDITNGKGVFVSFRGQTGTGQNYQAKGFTLFENSAIGKKVLTNEGNIYSPIIDASRFTVAPGNSNDYKIVLDGIAVCDGGIDKYVFSVDGGVTWHDMKFTGSNATDGNLSSASKSVNQYVVGQTRYPEKKADEITKNASFETQGLDINQYTHVTFDSGDAKKGNFDDWGLEADLNQFKHQGDLDIIFAAVPAADTSLRCEMLRIINYNRTRIYKTNVDNIVSDIQVLSDGNYLNANYNPSVTTNNGGYASAENKDNFALMKGIRADGVITHAIGYAKRITGGLTYAELPVVYADFPVYTTLSISGHARVEGGVDGHYWSIDRGRTWTPCGGSPNYVTSGTGANANWDDWTGISEAGSVFTENTTGTKFNSGKMLTCDLSDYEGKVVDIIVAAKPKKSDVYCPIARIDNVAVYGLEGTFFTRLVDWNDGTDGSYKKAGVVLDYGMNSQKYVEPDTTNIDGEYFSGASKWKEVSTGISYTIYEPQNADPRNARFYNDEINDMKIGGKVHINGYVVCHGGVKEYRYSLDNGKTWTKIDDGGSAANDSNTKSDALTKNITYAERSDVSFSLDNNDTKNGNFLTDRMNDTSDGKDFEYMLSFQLPAFANGTIKNLLVVAESNSGKTCPVLHIKLRFNRDAENPDKYHMAYVRTNPETTSQQRGWIVNGYGWETAHGAVQNARTVITLPVTEEGIHTLTFDVELRRNSSSGSMANAGAPIRCSIIRDSNYYTMFSSGEPPLASSDSRVIQTWEKTLTQTESVTLTFEVNYQDVKRGYMVWEWDITQLPTNVSYNYYFRLPSISLVCTTPAS